MTIMVMGGIALIAIAFIIFVTIRFQTMEAVYFREYGRKSKGEIIDVDRSSAEYHGGQKKQSYDIKVKVIHEGSEYEGEGVIAKETYERSISSQADGAGADTDAGTDTDAGADTDRTAGEGMKIECWYDSMDPGRVIFYDPETVAVRGQKYNKIAMAFLLAGFVLFIIGRVMM